MPPVQPAETLAALGIVAGIVAGIVVFLIGLVLLGVVVFIEEVALRMKRRMNPPVPQEEK